MRKLMCVLGLLVLFALPAAAEGPRFVPAEWWRGEWVWDVRFGAAYYTDSYDGDGLALYVQTPAVDWDKFWISFGVVAPVGHWERTRPQFSIATSIGEWCDVPQWMNWELGAFVCMGPYEAWGGQVGFFNMRF